MTKSITVTRIEGTIDRRGSRLVYAMAAIIGSTPPVPPGCKATAIRRKPEFGLAMRSPMHGTCRPGLQGGS
jgi:hypothetical protein